MLYFVLLTDLWFGALLISELGVACTRIQKQYKINFMYSHMVLKGTFLFFGTQFKYLFLCCLPHKALQGIFMNRWHI